MCCIQNGWHLGPREASKCITYKSYCKTDIRKQWTELLLVEGAHRPVRKAVSQPQQRPVRPPSLVNKNERMVQQVKDVFPQVPIDVIRKDICMLCILYPQFTRLLVFTVSGINVLRLLALFSVARNRVKISVSYRFCLPKSFICSYWHVPIWISSFVELSNGFITVLRLDVLSEEPYFCQVCFSESLVCFRREKPFFMLRKLHKIKRVPEHL